MKLCKAMSTFFVLASITWGLSAQAEEPAENQQLKSAAEIEALLDQIGVLDQERMLEEENSVFGTSSDYQFFRRDRSRRGARRGRDHGRRDRGRRRPPRRRRDDDGYGRRRPPAYRETVCWMTNARGQRFSGRGYSPRVAEQRAAASCYRYSYHCFFGGCRAL